MLCFNEVNMQGISIDRCMSKCVCVMENIMLVGIVDIL
jgi:hypothetical protein